MTVNERKRSSNRSGAVLLTVLTVACFAAVLLTAVISFVNRAHTNAYNNYNSEQAYYIASSALGSIHDYFEKDGMDYTTLLNMADANSGNGSSGTLKLQDGTGAYDIESVIPGGDCTVKVTRSGQGYIKVSVTGYCLGQAETINAYYSITELTTPATIDNVLYSNGDTTFGQSGSSAGSLTTRSTYKITNNASAIGSVITGADFKLATNYKWHNDPNNQAGSMIVVGHNFYADNTGCSFEPTRTKLDDNTSQYISVGGMFYVYQPIQIGVYGPNEYYMDLYCSTLKLGDGSDFTTYGNVYCYKLSDEEWDKVHSHTNVMPDDLSKCTVTKDDNGDFIVDPQGGPGFTINGDLYVEGDIRLLMDHSKRYNVNGTLYISPETKIETTGSNGKCSIKCDAISCAGLDDETIYKWIDDGYLGIRKAPGSDECWTVAQLRAMFPANRAQYIKKEGIVKGTVTSRNYKPSTDFGNYERKYDSTENFINGNADIKDALALSYVVTVGNGSAAYVPDAPYYDADLDMTFDYVIDGTWGNAHSCTLTGTFEKKKILIDMNKIDGDFVVKLDETFRTSNGFNIVIKNGEFDENTGTWVSGKEPDGFCYLIFDPDVPNLSLSGSMNIFDYYTYKYVMKNGYALNLSSHVDSDGDVENNIFVKPEDSDYIDGIGNTYGVYTPQPCRTYLMLNKGNSFKTGDNIGNWEGFLETILYAPEASVTVGYYGLNNLKYYKGNGKAIESFSTESRWLSILGAIICDSFEGGEVFGVGFVAPAPGSGVGTSGTNSTTEIKFDHYESR